MSQQILELYASEFIARRIDEAAQEALLKQLPRSASPSVLAFARQSVALGLRAIAVRLDPQSSVEPRLAVATPR